MKITVAVCTWNRAKLLDQTLAGMNQIRIPKDVEWELLVVNNNCTDDTDRVIAHYSIHLPIRRVFEPEPGLSNARNAAVKAARGDYILWTDDDVLVDKCWVEAYADAFERWPEAAIFGGPIYPWFEGKPPRWLEDVWEKIAFAYAARDLGPDPIPIGESSYPFGANYAISLPLQKRYRYDAALGRKAKGMLGGEEQALIIAMLRDGLQGVWVPAAKVHHFIPCSRQNTQYLRRYFRGQGLVFALTAQPSKGITLFGYPCGLITTTLKAEVKYRVRRLFKPPGVWIDDLIRSSWFCGQLQRFSSSFPSFNGSPDSISSKKAQGA
jgi:glucosyl-dolichyl phosphate glucuronosyltransferase